MPEDKYATTFDTWNKMAALYQEKFMYLDLYNASYDFFCGLVSNPNAKILDIGCGPGNISHYLLSKNPGYQILGVDVAPEMIALAKANNPTADFDVMDIRKLDQLTQTVDGIVAGFCMPYLAPDDCSKFLTDCDNLLLNDGILYLSFIEGNPEQSGYKTGSSGQQVYFYYYTEEYIKTQLAKQHIEVLQIIHIPYPATDPTDTHTVFVAQKSNVD